MYFDFRTSYWQDIRLIKRSGSAVFFVILFVALLIAPHVIHPFYVAESSGIFVFAIIVVGYMIAAGMAGLVSLGHAAFVGVGAYANAVLLSHGVPFLLSASIATVVGGILGCALALLSLRLSGLYLAIATLIFGLAVEHLLGVWEGLTGGHDGILVEDLVIFGANLSTTNGFYYVCLTALLGVILLSGNLMRSQTGRALIAIRDSEPAAQSLGVNLLFIKTKAFGLSGAITAFGGALMSHQIAYITPEGFNLMLSLQIVLAAVIGGLGSIAGAIMGSAFIGWLPEIISQIKSYLPEAVAYQPGPDLFLYGMLLVVFVVYEPLGLYGRWKKIELRLLTFPMDRKDTFAKTKTYMKSERVK